MSSFSLPKNLLAIVVLIALAAIMSGLLVTGGPFHQRDLRMDEIRVRDLNELKRELAWYYRTHQKLPDSLDVLKQALSARNPGYARKVFQDPVTERPYEYTKVSGNRFSLCLHFQVDTRNGLVAQYYPGDLGAEHPKGRACYVLDATDSLPPPGVEVLESRR
ncbi:MAG TPA: hypothetical protein V6C99_12075 [Oculatellaceae cyanobacterium]|jgi:type II secretory pathway pseudopilin PulG